MRYLIQIAILALVAGVAFAFVFGAAWVTCWLIGLGAWPAAVFAWVALWLWLPASLHIWIARHGRRGGEPGGLADPDLEEQHSRLAIRAVIMLSCSGVIIASLLIPGIMPCFGSPLLLLGGICWGMTYFSGNRESTVLDNISGKWRLLGCLALVGLVLFYIPTHPLVFMAGHRHCIKFAGLSLDQYAQDHDGQFPYHAKGYPNALLLMDSECYQCLTGPGYDDVPFLKAKETGMELAEEDCGRVYVQGLTTKCDGRIAILFDKLPTPGGDHTPFPERMWFSLCREVWTRHGIEKISEENWPEFARKQIELLVQEGIDRAEAERLYASKPK